VRLIINVRDGQVARFHFDAAGAEDGDYTITFDDDDFDAPAEYTQCDDPGPHAPHAYGSYNEPHGGQCPGRSGDVITEAEDSADDKSNVSTESAYA